MFSIGKILSYIMCEVLDVLVHAIVRFFFTYKLNIILVNTTNITYMYFIFLGTIIKYKDT